MFRRYFSHIFTGCVLLFFVVFFFIPVWKVISGGLHNADGDFTLFYLREVFKNPVYLQGLLNSLLIALCTTLFSILIALPLAWLGDRYDFCCKKLLTGALLLPMILAPFVGALGMQCIFGQYGAVNTLLEHLHLVAPGCGIDWFRGGFLAVVLLESLHLFPILYLNITASLANVDPMLLEAAADLGCTGLQRFRKISLPLIMPGIFAGASLVFIWSFTELGTPVMFSYGRCTPAQIFDGLNEIGWNPMPYALVTVVMLFSVVVYGISKYFFGRGGNAMLSKAGRSMSQRRLTGWRGVLVMLTFALVVFCCLLPHLGVLGLSFFRGWYHTVLPHGFTVGHFNSALGNSLTVPSIINSLRYSSLAVLLALVLGICSAITIVRGRHCYRLLLDTLVMLPLAVPGLVLAFGYLSMGMKGGLFYCFDPVRNPTVLLVLSYAVRRLPYVVRSVVAGLQQTSVSYEEAGASLGAGPMTVFRRITLPLITANVIAGGILAFSFSMLEVSDSLILAQKPFYYPITKTIFALQGFLGEGQHLASALGVWTMVFLGAALLTASGILGKKLGALFRA